MNRRSFLVAAVWVALCGHSPYRRFQLYRKTRLIILSSKQDAAANALSEALAALLLKHWPESKAQSAHAVDDADLVKLIVSRQLDVALLKIDQARNALAGAAPFAGVRTSELAALAKISDYLLISRLDLLEPIARKIVTPLNAHWRELDVKLTGKQPSPAPGNATPLPLHPAAQIVYRTAQHSVR